MRKNIKKLAVRVVSVFVQARGATNNSEHSQQISLTDSEHLFYFRKKWTTPVSMGMERN